MTAQAPKDKDNSPVRLILASGSPRRKELLGSLGYPFEIIVPDVDETPHPGELPENLVLRLAGEKGSAVAAGAPDALIIAADTIVVLEDDCDHQSGAKPAPRILNKPENKPAAVAMLEEIQGREHTVYTGVAIVSEHFHRFGASRRVIESFVCCSRVEIAPLNRAEIESYVDTGEPLDKAGSYAVQGLGAAFVASIHGSYTNVVGLPLAEVRMALVRLGIGAGR